MRKAVIFDLDGVLCSTVEFHYQSWKLALSAYDLPFSRQANEQLRGLTRPESLRMILSGREIPAGWFEDILDLKGRYYEQFVQRMTAADLPSGAALLLAELRQAGVKCGVASGSRYAVPVLRHLGILDQMEAVVDARHYQRSKPAPDAYLQAAYQLGVDPLDCLAIEDSPDGIASARAAGMRVIGLGAPGFLSAADRVFPDLSNVHWIDLQTVLVGARA